MKRALLASRFFDCPLLIDRSTAEAMVTALADDFEVEPMVDAQALESMARPERQTAIYEEQDGVAVVPIVGELAHRATAINSMSGSVGYAGMQTHLLKLAENPKVAGILLDMDRPGGEVGGLSELSDAIVQIGKEMPIWAIANSMMASAGYWLGSSTDRVLATPYSKVGSIGVVAMHVDISKALAKRGIVTTFVHAGKHKIDGNAFMPLSASARGQIASAVSDIYDQFVEHVGINRNMDPMMVRDTEARVYGSREALEVGLIDDISTLSQAIAGMQEAIKDRRRTFIASAIMKTYEDGLTEGKAIGLQEGIATGTKNAAAGNDKAVGDARLAAGKAERDRIGAIMNSAEAKGREALASHLAFATEMPAEAAEAILKASPKDATKAPKPVPQSDASKTAESILAAMRANSPNVQGDDDSAFSDEERRREEIRGNLGGRYRRQRAQPVQQIGYGR